TVGSDVYFRHGTYDPHSGEGQRLIAHEIVHVQQQGGLQGAASSTETGLAIGHATDPLESAASVASTGIERALRDREPLQVSAGAASPVPSRSGPWLIQRQEEPSSTAPAEAEKAYTIQLSTGTLPDLSEGAALQVLADILNGTKSNVEFFGGE